MVDFSWTTAHAQAFTEHHVIEKGMANTTAEKYCRFSGLFFAFAERKCLPLDKEAVKLWLKHLALDCDNGNSTRASRLSGLRAVCHWLIDEGELQSDPCKGVPTPKSVKKSAQKFSPAELKALFSEDENQTITSMRDRCILLLFYATGVRRDEMSRLTMHRISLGDHTGRAHIIGKGAKHRVVPFQGPIVHMLKTWGMLREQYVRNKDDHFFITLHGSRPGTKMGTTAMHRVIKRVAKRVGLSDESVFLHKLRSTYATDLYDEGIGINEIRMLMGHSSVDTTLGYIAISERHLQKSRISTAKWKALGVGS